MRTPIIDEIQALGRTLNTNQYRIVHLAAQYDSGLEWFTDGFKTAAVALAHTLEIHTSTAREWIRVGHALDYLPRINDAFSSNQLSYAKARILTRWADDDNEQELLDLAEDRTANRLTVAIANYLADDETEAERDQRHHDHRSVSVRTDGDGMIIIRAALPPAIGKTVAAALNTLIAQVAATPMDAATADLPRSATKSTTGGGQNASADASVTTSSAPAERSLRDRLRDLEPWQADGADEFCFPSLAQQRADALVLMLLERINVTTEVVIHVRGDGTNFDDGTPLTNNAVCQRLDASFVRMMIHDRNRRPIDATNRRRYPTTRQKRVVLEAHNHECVDCQETDIIDLDHNPSYESTGHTITTELEPRCAPCHRARHRRLATQR